MIDTLMNKFLLEDVLNAGIKNHNQSDYVAAEKIYEKILEQIPEHLKTIFLLGTLSLQMNKLIKAKKYLKKTIDLDVNHVNAHNNLGTVYKLEGNLEEAIKYYKKTIEIDNNHADAYNNLGVTLLEARNIKDAIEYFQKAVQINQNHPEAYENLGKAFGQIGKYYSSIDCYQKAIKINPNNKNVINNICITFSLIELNELSETHRLLFKKLFLFLFRRNDIDHSYLFSNAKLVLLNKNDYNHFKKLADKKNLISDKIIKELLEDELFQLILQKCLIIDVIFEKILSKIRKEILLSIKNVKFSNYLNFIISLAENCFLNEYVFFQSKEEIDVLKKIRKYIETNNEINEEELAILACYFPLNNLIHLKDKLSSYKSENNLFNILINSQIKEIKIEKELYNSFSSFKKIANKTSKIVRDQYEKNPYPRWRYTFDYPQLSPSITINNQIEPNKIEDKKVEMKNNVLIAGCGTGKHTLLSSNYINSNILAVDLSKASLSYAKRKIKEKDKNNIEFLHADILDLKNLDKKFSIIECVGVLHHMENPLTGLQTLLNLLETGGFLKLGLYSELARSDIVKVKEYILKSKTNSDIDSIRNFRQIIIDNKKINLRSLLKRHDFYSISSLRDLAFHVKEYRFTIQQIREIITNYNLEFLGFCNTLPKIEYQKFFPRDIKKISLENWINFESKFPNSFGSMYSFWIKKL